jgi:hypothetical protein
MYNQTYSLDKVALASEGIKTPEQTVCCFSFHIKLVVDSGFASQTYFDVFLIG